MVSTRLLVLALLCTAVAARGGDRASRSVGPASAAPEPASPGNARRGPDLASPRMQAARDPATGQVDLTEDGQAVLRYNYQTVEPGEVLGRVSEGNRIYARPRSNYLHPLRGLAGEVLTRDWSVDHPHHRGIYWAWPEVDFGAERGDLHALQKVFARPTGRLRLQSGADAAQVEAENLWLWDDREAIVREWALIRAHRAAQDGRAVDLVFRFEAMKEGVALARRGATAYGGLNVRLETPQNQTISVHTDLATAAPRRAWSDLSGLFRGNTGISGLTVLQHRSNPEYPGDWVQYPELSWCQPTFPTAGTRFALPPGRPLVLRYRLWIHAGGRPSEEQVAKRWDAWHAEPELPSPVQP